ncbi:MAG: hypothetical protein O2782_09505, partial [bacterium]|nr:hypothetical protein [bacterium]
MQDREQARRVDRKSVGNWSANAAFCLRASRCTGPATGVSGVDLYMRMPEELQKPPGQQWHWIGVGRPTRQEMESPIAGGTPAGEHEFTLYLPLYNSTSSLEIGVPSGATHDCSTAGCHFGAASPLAREREPRTSEYSARPGGV